MKTVVIWDQFGEAPLSYVVFDGDLRKFDRVYINAYIDSNADDEKEQALQDELVDLMYDKVTGYPKVTQLSDFPINAVSRDHAFVITAGFMP